MNTSTTNVFFDIQRIAVCLVFLACLGLTACTGILTNTPEFRDLVNRQLILEDTGEGRNWNLWRAPDLRITLHSEGYRLNLLNRAAQPAQSMFRDPARVEDLGSVVGAVIVISKVREYGMETGYPVVVGRITLADGESYPFEAEWRRDYSDHVRPQSD